MDKKMIDMVDDKEFDILLYIGRFQPFHNGHLENVKLGLEKSVRLVIIVGSSFSARSPKNPFTFEERVQMIRESLTEKENERTWIFPQVDHPFSDSVWIDEIMEKLSVVERAVWVAGPCRTGVLGFKKDDSSYYLEHFISRMMKFVETPERKDYDSGRILSSTEIRDYYFSGGYVSIRRDYIQRNVPPLVHDFLFDFSMTETKKFLDEEHKYYEDYKKSWESAPFEPIHVTVDAVIWHKEKCLLIERKNHPGKGLLALPGGFLDPKETSEKATIREVKEETGLDLEKVGFWCQGLSTVETVGRSLRGRVISFVSFLEIEDENFDENSLVANDDASNIGWYSEEYLRDNRHLLFEDHYNIILDDEMED